MPQEISDSELIRRYVEQGEDKAFESLLKRYYNVTFQRFMKHCRNPDTAADLTQQLWTQMVKSLESYQDDGRFPSFLMRSATNLLTDHWRRRGVQDKVILQTHAGIGEDEEDFIANAPDPLADTASMVELDERINHLTRKLIPALPCEQRLVFLLKHESEYWEEKQRLSWAHLAELNGLDEAAAWRQFERVRNALVHTHQGGQRESTPTCEDLLIFLVWTQAQRISKTQDYTWAYFAEILNVPENTLKTRYRAALKSLAGGLTELDSHD